MSLLLDRLAPRIAEEDGAFRTRMLGIAAGMSDVIALGRGDPDFHTPAHIVEAAKAALDANHHHYTGPTGIPQLREAIAAAGTRVDVINTSSMDNNVEFARHGFFNINRLVIDDLYDIIVEGKNASQRNVRLERSGDFTFVLTAAPAHVSINNL